MCECKVPRLPAPPPKHTLSLPGSPGWKCHPLGGGVGRPCALLSREELLREMLVMLTH